MLLAGVGVDIDRVGRVLRQQASPHTVDLPPDEQPAEPARPIRTTVDRRWPGRPASRDAPAGSFLYCHRTQESQMSVSDEPQRPAPAAAGAAGHASPTAQADHFGVDVFVFCPWIQEDPELRELISLRDRARDEWLSVGLRVPQTK